MPDWCSNRLGVAGTYTEVQRFIENAKGDPPTSQALCFQKLYPAETSDTLVKRPRPVASDGVEPTWYKDRMDKWGVKWNADLPDDQAWRLRSDDLDWEDAELEPDDECCAIIRFTTPSGPPTKLFDKVARDYPELVFRLRFYYRIGGKGVAEWWHGVRTICASEDWQTIDALDWMDWDD
jgi:hypothetical protein